MPRIQISVDMRMMEVAGAFVFAMAAGQGMDAFDGHAEAVDHDYATLIDMYLGVLGFGEDPDDNIAGAVLNTVRYAIGRLYLLRNPDTSAEQLRDYTLRCMSDLCASMRKLVAMEQAGDLSCTATAEEVRRDTTGAVEFTDSNGKPINLWR